MAVNRNDVPGDDPTLPGGPGMNRVPERDPEHLIPPHTHAAAPGTIAAGALSDDPHAVRGEIERTRARMSQTIDQLEGVLLRKKEEISDRLDVTAPVRQNPWAFAGGVFGAGLLLGFATGGGKKTDDDDDHVKIPRALLEGMGLEEVRGSRGRGSRDWEDRARELMQVVARQEDEIQDLRAALYGGDVGDGGLLPDERLDGIDSQLLMDTESNPADEWDEGWNYDDGDDDFEDMTALGLEDEGGFHIGKPVAAAIAAGVAALVGGAATKLLRGRHAGEMDVEVELEPRHGAATDVRVDEGYRAARRDVLGANPAPAPRFGADAAVEHGYGPSATAYAGGGYPRGDVAGRREMEVEVELERPLPRAYDHDYYAHHEHHHGSLPVSPVAAGVAAGAAALMGGLAAMLLRGRSHRHEMDVEVELEQRPASRPSAASQPRPQARPQGRPSTGRGEIKVEVELEGQGSTQRRYPTSLDRHATGTTSAASPRTQGSAPQGEREYEVKLEGDGLRRDDSDPWGGGSGNRAPLM